MTRTNVLGGRADQRGVGSLKACGIDGKTACLDSGWGRSTVDILPLQRVGTAAVVAVTVGGLSTVDIGLGFRTEVSGIDVSLFAVAGTKSGLDKLLVNSKDRLELFDGDVVQEQALAKLSVGDGESLLAVSSLLDGLGGVGNELLVKEVVVHGKTDGRDKSEPLVSLSVADELSRVSESDRVGHVDGDGVAVSERNSRSKLEGRRPGVTKGDDSVEAKLVQVGGFELEHGLDTSVADLGTGCNDVLAALLVSETGLDELLSVLDKQVPDSLVADRGDFDELGETVSDLSNGESLEEGEVEEGVERSVVGTESVLQLSVVESDLDRDGSIDETDQSGGDSDEVGSSSVRRTSVTSDVGDETATNNEGRLSSDGTE